MSLGWKAWRSRISPTGRTTRFVERMMSLRHR
jgi:hypothetical protein